MKHIGLVVDEGADLPKDIIQKHNIEIVPIKLDWPEIKDLPGKNTFQKMREAEKRGIKSFGKTSQPSPKDFLDAYKKQFENFEEIVCITLTSKLSGTYNSAIQAKNFLLPEQQKKVFVVDSLNVSGGEALLVFKAIELIKNTELNAEKIAEKLKNLPSRIHLRVIFKDPKWIEASGRISSPVANWVRKMSKIGIRPILGFRDGVLKAIGIKTGAKDIPLALFREIKEKTKKLQEENKKIWVIISHGDNLTSAQKLKKMIKKEIKGASVLYITLVNNIIGAIAGPDALALSWTEG